MNLVQNHGAHRNSNVNHQSKHQHRPLNRHFPDVSYFFRRELEAGKKQDEKHAKLANGFHLYHRFQVVYSTRAEKNTCHDVAKEWGQAQTLANRAHGKRHQQKCDQVHDEVVVDQRRGGIFWLKMVYKNYIFNSI